MPNPQKIEAGDVVKISSDPKVMTVSHIAGDEALCIWFNREEKIESHKLDLDTLVLVTKKPKS
ncbi:MAG TPA: hypothetical protein VL728_04385 [Cyclobacteriaceae bacterium]|jgi:uncharacterized protein YodC (DUF2158 family)|nr:hypothetical protein [Cyclobacteriaceae bacterium]